MTNLPIDFSNTEIAFASRSNTELLRAYSLFKIIDFPLLVKTGSVLMQTAFKLGAPITPLVKWTIFKQFCGGESLENCRPLLAKLKRNHVHAMLDFAAEGESSEEGFDAATAELLKTANEAARHTNVPFVVFKLTGIARFGLLEKVSKCDLKREVLPQLSSEEQAEWHKVMKRVNQICDAALGAGRPVMIDAEETWIQPAIDFEVERLMRLHNRDRAWIFGTVQLYRHDRLDYLKNLTKSAKAESWKLGVKLVRGAYMEKERDYAKKHSLPSPIQPDKSATDSAYDAAINFCFENLDTVSFCIGTHNEASTAKAAHLALEHHLASQQNVWFSQLYGMSDHLTYNLAKAGLNAAKYLPYGAVATVVPYLIRRAQENTSVAGQSGRELQLIELELKRRRLKN